MKNSIYLISSILLLCLGCEGFSPTAMQVIIRGDRKRDSRLTILAVSSDVEALLQKARELRAQAEAEEAQLHHSLLEKKSARDMETDALIDDLFPDFPMKDDDASLASLATTLEEKRLSTNMLKRVVERLHAREISAQGIDHVESSVTHSDVQFRRVSEPNSEELNRVRGLISHLLNAAEILDGKHSKESKTRHAVDKSHWSTGELHKVLSEKVHFLGREHDDQFKKRLEEYYEAARKKDRKDGE